MLTTAITGVLVSLLAWLGVEDAVYYAPAVWVVVKVLVVVAIAAVVGLRARRAALKEPAALPPAATPGKDAGP